MAVDTLDTNLVRSAKRPKEEPSQSNTLAPAKAASRRKRILKVVAYVVFFFWSLITFTLLKVPDSAVANFILKSLNENTPYQWQAEKIGIGFFPTPHIRMEKLGLEPKFPGGGVPLYFDDIRIFPNPFSLIPINGPPALGGSFRAEAYKSVVHGHFATGTNMALRIETDSLDLARLTPLTRSGIDLKGLINNLFIQLALPNQRLAMADGEVTLKMKNVVFDPSALGLPIALPLLNLGDVDVHGVANRGQVKIDRFKVGSAGKDLELQISSGTVVLSDVVPSTRYELHLLVKPSASIEKAVPGLGGMLASMATVKPDGFYAMKLQGTLSAPSFPSKD